MGKANQNLNVWATITHAVWYMRVVSEPVWLLHYTVGYLDVPTS
jgi:hypothetical protein